MKKLSSPLLTCSFTVCGLNLERFLAVMQQEEIPLEDVRRTGRRTLRCQCRTADFAAVTQIAADKGWRIREVRPERASAVWSSWKARPGLWVGMALALLMLLLGSQRIWRVEIVGAGAYQADIAAYLAEEGIRPGMLRAGLDATAWEEKLSWRYPETAWFHVYAAGMTLRVECTQGHPMPELDSGQPGDLVASRDGVVETIEVFAGTAAVRPGDIVRKGQVLIRGQERGRDETVNAVQARGSVTARCWRTVRVRVPLNQVKSWETGRETVVTQLCTPWFQFPAETEKPEYLAMNLYESVQPVAGVFFPVWRKTLLYREAALERVRADGEECRREALAAAETRLKEALRGDEIIDKWVDYCMIEGEFFAVSMTGEWRTEIGKPAT